MNENIENLIDRILNEQEEIVVTQESSDLIDWEQPIDNMNMDVYFENVYLKPIKEFMAVNANNSNSIVSVPAAPVNNKGVHELKKSSGYKAGINKAKKISEAIKDSTTNIKKIKLEVCSECFNIDNEKEQHKCIETIETILENSVKSLKEGTSTRLDLSNSILNEIESIKSMEKEISKEKKIIKTLEKPIAKKKDIEKLKEPLEKMEDVKNKLKEGVGKALLGTAKLGLKTTKFAIRHPKTTIATGGGIYVADRALGGPAARMKQSIKDTNSEAKEDADKYLLARKYGQPVDPQNFLKRQYERELQNYDNKKVIKDSEKGLIRSMYKKFRGEN